ncbi:phage tail family protein [Caldibacillus thermoamylovorans]|uniref:phage tail family protein n=1 Tax=Caldibacillus thermoamylovorans TaxID=35841 RepID=UPI001D06E838|nr:phage tail family protein [Caldibacillus thermoamylovorans]MCB5934499.1 phage tail family protein [Bacillus sp. DFI.2.34]MCB7076474.1 phage tail family protein [Caldibacillus thermoamylovorans]
MYGITFNGKHSYRDFGVTIAEKNIGYPEKQKIKVQVPFSNIEYDFSEIYGEQTYTPRPLSFTFNVVERHKLNDTVLINLLETQLSNWLLGSIGKQRLYDDSMPGYYYLAEVEGGLDFDELWNHGKLTVQFTAYPFMISELPEGHDIWDEFNFELDVAQITDFEVNGTLNVVLYNVGTPNLIPGIETSAPMQIVKNSITYNVPTGKSKSDEFRLQSGENKITITGNGTIKFLFYKELI